MLVKQLIHTCHMENMNVRVFIGTENSCFPGDDGHRQRYNYQQIYLYEYAKFFAIDGVIMSYAHMKLNHSKMRFAHYRQIFKDIPAVVFASDQAPEIGITVRTDNRKGICDCITHLYSHGRRHICFLSGPELHPDGEARLAAFRETMTKLGLSFDEKSIAYGDFTIHAEHLVRQLLQDHPETDAIVCANDEMAEAVYNVLRERRITPGREIAVTGFDDNEAAALMRPPLTTCRQDPQKIAAVSVQSMKALLDGYQLDNVFIPAAFINRSSCGCMYRAPKNNIEGANLDNISSRLLAYKNIQKRTVDGARLLRELIAISDTDDDGIFLSEIGRQLRLMGFRRADLYLFDEPLHLTEDEGIAAIPDEMRCVLDLNGETLKIYSREDAPRITPGTIADDPDDNGDRSIFVQQLLYFREYQYGLLSLSVERDNESLVYLSGLELGTAFHFHHLALERMQYQRILRDKNEMLSFAANHDNLTQLYNRLGAVSHMLERLHAHEGEDFYMIMADLDHLKNINDSFGHVEGDCAILEAAEILKQSLGSEAIIGRTGGDEFMAMCPTADFTIDQLRDNIRQRCRSYNDSSGKPYYVELSVGCAVFTSEKTNELTRIVATADQDLYIQKADRRNSSVRSPLGGKALPVRIRAKLK